MSLFPLLVRIGTFGTAVEGGRYVWRAASKLAQGTALAPVLSGSEVITRSLTRELGPFDPFKILDPEEGLLAPVAGAFEPKTIRDLKKAERLTRGHRDFRGSLTGAADGSGPSPADIYESTKRRFSDLSKRFGDRALQAHNASPDCPEALKLADQCLALAELSQKPPTDPRQILTEDMPPSMKSALTDVIDGCNRIEEPDMAQLESRLLEAANPLAGGKKPCCDACAKKTGPCKSGACGVPTTGHDHPHTHGPDSEDGMPSNLMLFGPGENEEAELSLDDDEDPLSMGDDGIGDNTELDELEQTAGGLLKKTKSCATGTCWTK